MIRLCPCNRWPRPSLLPGVLLAGWMLAFTLFLIVSHQTGRDTGLCHFQAMTGHPCATCGATRAGLSLLRGAPLDALRLNPLVTIVLMIATSILLFRLFTGLQVVLKCTRRGWIMITALLIATVVMNWIYVSASLTR